MVCTQELVCRVPKARWPVSLITSAASMVSRSRISPTSTNVGVLAEDVLERFLEAVGIRTHLALIDDASSCCGCRYSIGSSMVTMCSWRSVLICR